MDHSPSLARALAIAIAISLLSPMLGTYHPLCAEEPPTVQPEEKAKQYWLTVAAFHENKFGVFSFGITGEGGERLVVGDSPLGEPSWSPDGTRLAFVSFDQGPGQICVMDAKTKKLTRLTNSVDWERNPTWSPDGRKLAFTSRRDNGDEEIYVMDADGNNATNLTKAVGADADPTWSPDGKQIAFASQRGGNRFRLSVMNADGTEQQTLSDREFTGWLFPDWSPNGKSIVVGEYVNGNVNLLLFNMKDKTFREIIGNNGCNTFARWSPDGRQIAFAHFDSPPPSYRAGQQLDRLTIGDLMLYDVDSAARTELGKGIIPGWGPRPSWQLRKDAQSK